MKAIISPEKQKKNDLEVERLLSDINAHFKDFKRAGKETIQNAVKMGEILWKIKELVPHGKFASTVESRCDFSDRTAQTYMKLAGGWDEIVERLGIQAYEMTIIGGLRVLSSTKEPARIEQKKKELRISYSPSKSNHKPVDGTDECPHGGPHDYDEEACKKCHDPRPDKPVQANGAQPNDAGATDGPIYKGPAAKGRSPDEMAQRELVDLFQETERFYKCLAQNLSIINRRVKHKLYGDCNDSLDVSFKDFKTMKKDSLK
jgi:hypothetical protein